MSTYDSKGQEIFWGWDQLTQRVPAKSMGWVMPGPKSVFHAFVLEVNRRRITTLCGHEMLTYSVPGNIEDLLSDSFSIPICRACAEASDTAHVFKLIGARFARKGA